MGPRTGAFIVAVALAAPFLAGCNKISPRIVGLSSLKDSATPFTLAGAPASPSNVSALNVFVLSSTFTEYRFAVGPAASTDCQNPALYSAPLPVTQVIGGDLSAFTDGELILCVSGVDGNSSSAQLGPTLSHRWIKDTVPPPKPSVVALASGVSSPGNDRNPRITVGPTTPGDLIEIFADSACTLPKGSTTAVGTATTVTSFTLTGEGAYNFHARATDPAGNKSGCSPVYATYVLDITPPTILKVFADAVEQGWHFFGDDVLVKIQFSEAVVISGTPRLQLNTGTTHRQAIFEPGHAENTDTIKVFRYVVDAGDYSLELDYDGANAFVLSADATLKDSAGNNAVTTLAPPGNGNSLSASTTIQINGLPADLTLSTTPPITGLPYRSSQSFTIQLHNGGGQPATSLTATLDVPSAFTLTGQTCMTSLAPNATCQYELQFTSPGATTVSGSLTVDFQSGTGLNSRGLSFAASGAVASASITPLYANASDWNSYVAYANPTQSRISQSSPASCPTSTTAVSCIHGGELKTLSGPTPTSCAGITIEEALSAFRWKCLENGSSPIQIISVGLKPESHLADLIDFPTARWKDNALRVFNNGIPILESSPAAWWGNAISILSSSSRMDLANAGQVYLVPNDLETGGLNITADGVALVVAPGKTLRRLYDPSALPNCDSNGLYSGTGSFCLLGAGAASGFRRFLWLEGRFNGAAADINATTVTAGLFFRRVANSKIRHVDFSGALAGGGIVLNGSQMNVLQDIRVANVSQDGLFITNNAKNNIITRALINNITTSSSSAAAANFSADNNIVTSILIAANESNGVMVSGGAQDSVLSHLSAVNNGMIGLQMLERSANVVLQGAFLNNGGGGLSTSKPATPGSLPTVYAKIFSRANASYDIADNDSISGGFHFDLYAQNCQASPGGGVSAPNCAKAGNSTAEVMNGAMALTGLLVGPQPATIDATTSPIAASMDWFSVPSFLSAWGKSTGTSFPSSGNRGKCYGLICQLWDFSWKASHEMTGVNGSLIPYGACPTKAAETITQNLSGGTTRTFLVNAVEIMDDGLGNDDGLCESGEACIYSPNIGVYQGHGELKPCTFTDGAVTGVKMFGHEFNGY